MSLLIEREQVLECIEEEIRLMESRGPEDLSHLLHDMHSALIEAVLTHTRGNQAGGARMLGVHRHTLKAWHDRYFKNKSKS